MNKTVKKSDLIMTNLYLYLLIVKAMTFGTSSRVENDRGTSGEFCFWEAFKPDCPAGEVLVINQAKYGRMNIGKCLTEKEMQGFGSQSRDPRYLGCHNDVTDVLNSKCALKKSCEIKIIDLENTENTACHLGLKMYLEVEHSCLPVIELEDSCHVFVTGRPRYISPKSIDKTLCGSQGKPLLVETPKGQRVKVSIERLSQHSSESSVDSSFCTSEVGIVSDKINNNNFTICQEGLREQKARTRTTDHVVSKGNLISITILQDVKALTLMKLEADGCLDIISPEDAWLKRTNDDIVIGCYSSKQNWYLRCENKQWKGAIGNCSVPASKNHADIPDDSVVVSGDKIKMSSSQQVLIIVAICGFGLVACLAIICIGGLCLKRYKSKDTMETKYFNVYGGNANTLNQRNPMFQTSKQEQLADNMPFGPGHVAQSYLSGGVDDDRYQVLDKDEVAKESAHLVLN